MSSIPSDALSDRESQESSQMPVPITPPDMKCVSLRNSVLSFEDFADLNIYVGPNMDLIKCHRFVLAKNSDVLGTMINDRWFQENPGHELCLPADDPEAFKILVQYMYTREVEDNVSSITLIQLLDLSRKYNVAGLLEKATDQLSRIITTENALSVYIAGKVYELENLKLRAFDVIRVDAPKVILTDEFISLSYDDLRELLASDELRVSEADLLRALCRWSEEACISNAIDITPENCRMMLKDSLQLIRYGEISAEQFIEIAEDKDVYEVWEKYEILHYLNNFAFEPKPKRRRVFEFNKNPRHRLIETIEARGLFRFRKKTPELYENGLATTIVQVNKLISLHTIGFYLPKKKYGMGNRGRTLVVKIKREGSAGPTSSVDIVEASQYVKFEFGQPTYCKLKLPKYAQLLPDVSYELSFKFNNVYTHFGGGVQVESFTDRTFLDQQHFRVRCINTDVVFAFKTPIKKAEDKPVASSNDKAGKSEKPAPDIHFQIPQLSFVIGK